MSFTDSEELKFKEDFIKFFENVLKTKENISFKIDEIKMSPCCPTGENFVGEVIKLAITGHHSHDAEKLDPIKKSVVIKRMPPTSSILHSLYNISKMFQNEINFYENILPILQNYGIKIFPEYYGRGENFLALEDLSINGHKMASRIQGFTFEELKMILRELANFHAISFALQKAEDKKFDNALNNLQEAVYSQEYLNSTMSTIWENSLKFATMSLQSSSDLRLKNISQKIYKKYSGTVLKHLIDIIKPSNKLQVLCHGDLWTNNIMVKCDEQHTLIDIKLIDLQAARCSSCILDVMHFLFTSSSPELIHLHLNEFLETYFEDLTSRMKILGISPDFTIHDLREEFREKISYGLLVSFLMFTCITKINDEDNGFPADIQELNSEKTILKMYKALNVEYHLRLHGFVSALLDLEFLE